MRDQNNQAGVSEPQAAGHRAKDPAWRPRALAERGGQRQVGHTKRVAPRRPAGGAQADSGRITYRRSVGGSRDSKRSVWHPAGERAPPVEVRVPLHPRKESGLP